MKSGKLRHSILIQKKVLIRNSYGEEEVTWEDFTLAYASIEPLAGREYFLAQQFQQKTDYKITLRYRSGIKPHFIIKWGDRTFDIISVLNTGEMNRELIIYASEFTSP